MFQTYDEKKLLLTIESTCQAIPSVPNATPSSTAAESDIGATVQYTCRSNHYFDHVTGTTSATITCQQNAQWSTLNGQCTGE